MTYDEAELPLLKPEEWVAATENTEAGEELPTPFVGWIPPIVKGRMTVVGAATEVGKTAFGLQAFRGIVDAGYSACYATTEMTPTDLFERLHPQFESEETCKKWINDKKPIVSEPGIDAGEVVRIIREGFDFVVIDHVHDLPFDGHEDLARKVKRIASLAPYTDTAILMLAQVKQPDPMFPREPNKYDFSQTKAIAEAAALAFILHKEDDAEPNVDLYCVKNRFGPKNLPVSLKLNPRTVTFERA